VTPVTARLRGCVHNGAGRTAVANAKGKLKMFIYNYTAQAAGGGPLLVEVILQPAGTTSVFKLHHVVPQEPDVIITNRTHDVLVLADNGPPAKGLLYLRPVTPAASATLLMKVTQGGSIVAAPGGGNMISGGVALGGTIIDAMTGATSPIVLDGQGRTAITPLTPGAQAEVFVAVH
jgi:hypothetical protein